MHSVLRLLLLAAFAGAAMTANAADAPKDQVLMKFDTTGRVRQVWTVPKGADDHEQPGSV